MASESRKRRKGSQSAQQIYLMALIDGKVSPFSPCPKSLLPSHSQPPIKAYLLTTSSHSSKNKINPHPPSQAQKRLRQDQDSAGSRTSHDKIQPPRSPRARLPRTAPSAPGHARRARRSSRLARPTRSTTSSQAKSVRTAQRKHLCHRYLQAETETH
jgi:hypothetical protein